MNKIIKTTQTHLIMKLVLVSFGLQFPGWTVGGVNLLFPGPSALCWLKGRTANPAGCVAGLNVTEAHLINLVKVSGLSSTHPVFNMGQTLKKKVCLQSKPLPVFK